MPRLGAHMSIGGGLPRAVDRAVRHGCETLQIFTNSVGQWRTRCIPEEEIRAFRSRVTDSGIEPVVSHASYLINLAAIADPLRTQSIAALGAEVDRAERLGLAAVVLHPGAAMGAPEDEALKRVARALLDVLRARRRGRTVIALEHTAGQGSTLGWRFEHLRAILEEAGGHRRIGVCLDTCHLLAAGYDIRTGGGVDSTLAMFDRVVGLDRLRVVHLNDSRTPVGSRVDRHTHIGDGAIGLEGFRALVNDARLGGLPMLIETPKAISGGTAVLDDGWDQRNLSTLRRLLSRSPPPRTSSVAPGGHPPKLGSLTRAGGAFRPRR
jgi:deoxyribonuclease IV